MSFHYSAEAVPTLKLSQTLEITDGYSNLHFTTVGNPRGFSKEDLSCFLSIIQKQITVQVWKDQGQLSIQTLA